MFGALAGIAPRVMEATPATLTSLMSDVTTIATEVFSIGSSMVTWVLDNWIALVPLALSILYFGFNGIRSLIKGV